MVDENNNSGKTTKNVWFLGLTSFLNDIGGEMLAPILPLFLSYLGASGLIIGIVAGVREGVTKLLQVFAGYWSDRVDRRKPFIVLGYFLSGFSKIFLALSNIWPLAIVFAGTERIGKGIREAPRDVIIAESGMPHGKAFSIHKALDTAGGVLGAFIVFILYDALQLEFKTIILIAACVVFLSLIPITFVKDIEKQKSANTISQSIRGLPSSVWVFIIISGFFAFANFGYMFLILRAQQSFSNEWIIVAPLLLYILFNLIYASFAVPFGMLSDKFGRRKIVMIGYSLFIIMSVLLAIFSNIIILIICFTLFGLIYAILQSQQKALVADLTPKELDGTAIGAFNTITGLAALPAGFVAGFLWDLNPSFTFIFGAVVCSIGLIVFYIANKQKWF